MTKNLISKDYKAINQYMHDNKNYGETNHFINDRILNVVISASKQNACNSILDYGCGKGLLIKKLRENLSPSIKVTGYDPGIAEYDIEYSPADFVTCLDVLEHIEPENINKVLNDISDHTSGLFICIIDLLPAQKKLPDGRNAHLLIAPHGWWLDKLSHTFKAGQYCLYSKGNLNKKICYVGTNKNKYIKLLGDVFLRTFL